jgi:hypothetical protein
MILDFLVCPWLGLDVADSAAFADVAVACASPLCEVLCKVAS